MKVSTGKIHTIMKTKNIFLTAISALFIFAACTEEKIIDEPGVSGKGDLVIELSPSSVSSIRTLPPSGVNLKAFERRLKNTLSNKSGSIHSVHCFIEEVNV